MSKLREEKMSSRAGKISKRCYDFNRKRAAEIIIELYSIIQNQPLNKRIGFALRVDIKRLPK